ncbi:MAG: T9SS type A sorting domain-containing protein [Bacteroidales bacterium]
MKKLITLTLSLCIGIAAFAQTVLISDDFESYTVGQGIGQQCGGDPWTTWSGTLGGSEDPIVSNEQASNGTKSLKVVTNNDCILPLGDSTTGRYHYDFKMRIPTGKMGYFNVLQEFAGSNSFWGIQVTLVNGTATVDASAASAATFTYNHDTWIPMRVIVDLDDDYASYYANNEHIYSYQWSLGATGSGGPVKLGAGDFFGHSTGGVQGEYFVDEVVFTKVDPLEAPSNLVANQVDNVISLTWDAPTSIVPDRYIVIRNGVVLADDVTTTSYDDVLPVPTYPNDYKYVVKAYKNLLGYSGSSNIAEVTIPGGTDREKVLTEVATGLWCQYCPGVAFAIEDFIANGKDIAPVKYHYDDEYEIPDNLTRIGFYGIQNFPTTVFDGVEIKEGGNAQLSVYTFLLPSYETREQLPSTHELTVDISELTPDNYVVTVTAEQLHDYFASDIFLFAALTESHIPHNWVAGITELDYVNRAMFPSGTGTYVNFSSGNTQVVQLEVNLDPTFVKDNCQLVIWLQHMPTQEVIQTKLIDMKYVSVKDKEQVVLNMFPNPTSKYLNIEANNAKPITYMISDLRGQVIVPSTVMEGNTAKIDVSSWKTGMYILRTDNGVVRKFSVITK